MTAVVPGPVVQVFDLTGEPPRLRPDRWTPHVRRDPAGLRGVSLHQWDTDVGTEPRNRARWGEPLAFARRALAAPYTISCGVTGHGRVPVVSIAHPPERYTYASDAGNAGYLAIGVMGSFPFTEERRAVQHTPWSEELQAAVDVALQVAARLLGDAAEDGAPWRLVTHRQCVNGPRDHVACPGEMVVRMALASRPVLDGLLVADPDLVLDHRHGLPWPAEWRRYLREAPDGPPVVAIADASPSGEYRTG